MNIPFLFVFCKAQLVQVLTLEQEMQHGQALRDDGWIVTTTINPLLWIAALAQHEPSDALAMIAELKRPVTGKYSLRSNPKVFDNQL